MHKLLVQKIYNELSVNFLSEFTLECLLKTSQMKESRKTVEHFMIYLILINRYFEVKYFYEISKEEIIGDLMRFFNYKNINIKISKIMNELSRAKLIDYEKCKKQYIIHFHTHLR